MNEQKNSESRTFKVLISIMIMTGIIMVTTLLHFYLFLCFEWIKLDGHIIPYFMPKEEFEVSTISENQISGIYEYNGATYVGDSLRVGYINFILSGTEYDRDSYSYPGYLDNVAEIAVNQYYAFKNFPTSFGEDFLYNLEFSNGRLIHCTVLDKKTGKILGDPREISWIELHDMISE